MHFERLLLDNLGCLGVRELDFSTGARRIRKWILLPAGTASTHVLRALALAGLGRRQALSLAGHCVEPLAASNDRPTQLETVQIRHAPQERGPASPSRRRLGWRIESGGRLSPLPPSAMNGHDPAVPKRSPELGRCSVGRLLVGYGSRMQPHTVTDCFDISPDQPVRRCAGLFDLESRLTDPVAFLERLRHKAKYRAGRARALLGRLVGDLRAWTGATPECWPSHADFEIDWPIVPAADRAPLTVVLDLARHLLDASLKLDVLDPLQQPGVVLMDRPERWCDSNRFTRLFELLDTRFPQLQFVLALSSKAIRRFPTRLLDHSLEVPQPRPRRRRVPPRSLPRGTVLLVDVDGTLPNLALMKLSRDLKGRGHPVRLARGVQTLPRCDTVMASCVFSTPQSARRLALLQKTFGQDLQTGGSGVDLRSRLPPAIEAQPADYSLYPELGDRALGFLTRGCPQRCPFCVVPVKEGTPRQVSDLDTVLQGRRKLILLDDNLLAHPSALELLEEMARRDLEVNFNQTLDVRRLTPESAALLRRIRCSNVSFTRRNYHFSLNDCRGLERLRERYTLLGTTRRDNAEFVCMIGFNSSLAEDVERFRFLRSLPHAYVFVQRYRPVPGSPAPNLSRLFDDRADALLDELVRIVFTQNMKSMETYYRWLAREYARQRGRIHQRLVETLFRYNSRSRMGGFLMQLEDLARTAPGVSRSGHRAPAREAL